MFAKRSKRWAIVRLSIFLLLLLLLPGTHATAVTYYVDGDCTGPGDGSVANPFCQIQVGIDASGTGDTVQVAPGTYVENITMKSGVLIQGVGAGDDPSTHSIIDGGANGSVVSADGVDSAARLQGFKITNGSSVEGGGMHIDNASPVVSDCTFSGNSAPVTNLGSGGGMFIVNASPTIIDCIFSGNDARNNGGGMYNSSSSPIIIDCIFAENTAWNHGGGLYNAGDRPRVDKCVFEGNTAEQGSGGGMHNNHSSPLVTNSTFANNEANFGGAMLNESSSPSMINCSFYMNHATSENEGCEIYSTASGPTLTNCTFYTFCSQTIFIASGSATLTNCTLSAQGVTLDLIWNTLQANPPAVVTYSNIWGGYNEGGVGNISADPLFVDQTAGDLRLQPSSPCIDAGNNAATTFPVDHDGRYRIYDGDTNGSAVIDMGAHEYASPALVKGDFNLNFTVELADAILVLQLCSGLAPSGNYHWYVSVDGDTHLGVEDVLYVLQKFSNQRD